MLPESANIFLNSQTDEMSGGMVLIPGKRGLETARRSSLAQNRKKRQGGGTEILKKRWSFGELRGNIQKSLPSDFIFFTPPLRISAFWSKIKEEKHLVQKLQEHSSDSLFWWIGKRTHG